MLTVMLSVFALFMVTVLLLFRSGGSIQWKKELTQIDGQFARGEKREAALELEAFGKRWPDAQNTVPWNEKAGRYFAEISEWDKSAAYYQRAVEIDEERFTSRAIAGRTSGLRAKAGEAYFQAGDTKAASEFLNQEIKDISRAVGDHDRAHYFLGLIEEKSGNFARALPHFQAIAKPEIWKTDIDRFYRELNEKLIEPAKKQAAEKSTQEILASK
jgi:tetratricopeptide (TPR) repeat protein